ncbi:MAG: prenyltransferase [Candidatus Lokiarchaeia archaeon]
MSETVRLLTVISRPEFLPANLASIVIGLSWAINPSLISIWELAILVILNFTIITVVAAFGAQMNTMYDYELDSKDPRKKQLVQAMGLLGRGKVKSFIIVEFLISAALIFLLLWFQGKPVLLFLWMAGSFLAYAYSAPPLRLKARSWLAFAALLLVLCFLPILFVFYTFASEMDPFFLLFLVGQALTVYGVIVATETRDYFGDKEMGVETMTVRLGLVRGSLLGIVLLAAGCLLSGTAFFLKLVFEIQPVLTVFLLAIVVADYIVLREYKKIYVLSKEYASSNGRDSIAQEIVSLSAHNPKWINLVMMATVFMSLVLLAGKFIF